LNNQSPIYSLKFTVTWIIIYIGIVALLIKIINIFVSIYLALWILNIIIEISERTMNRFNKKINTVER